MVDPLAAHADALAILHTIVNLEGRVHDGDVPDDIPADEYGHVLPYVVLFSGIGQDIPAERDLTQLASTAVLDFGFQTTCVGPTAAHARAVALDVRAHFINAPIGHGWVLPDERSLEVGSPIRDTNVTPARYFMPLRWRLVTT